MSAPDDAAKARRRRKWIVALSLPAYITTVVFALLAWAQGVDFPEWTLLAIMPIVVTSLLCFVLAPFCFLIDLWVLFRDPYRRQRSRRERIGLRLLVLFSPAAWFVSARISDAYHLWR
jgi:hypothetical protein